MMKERYRTLLLLMLIVTTAACTTDRAIEEIQNSIDEIGSHWVPDRREGVSNVSVSLFGGVYTLKGELCKPAHRDSLLAWFGGQGLSVADSTTMLPDTTAGSWALVSVAVANMRAQPRHAAELITQASMGTPLRIMKRDGSWLWVQTPDMYLGWITSSSVEIAGDEGIAAWRSAERVIVLQNSAFIYAGENEQAIVTDVPLGGIVTGDGISAKHFRVVLPDGRRGFMRLVDGQLFSRWSASAVPTVASLEMYGRRLMGVSYLWGGTSAYALDCSGFMKTIFFVNGVILARDASLQQRHGTAIESSATDWSQLLPGDILFFGSQKTRRAGHVGLYLGDGEVIHESGMVRIDNLGSDRPNYSNYLFTTYIEARRVIGLPSQPGLMHVKEHQWYVNISE
ncbi:MAG: NlpC/P60 family protein [Bacteroidetes bacterium]|nr:NlpC/P60 family protein [Bacteroidota bacterium]